MPRIHMMNIMIDNLSMDEALDKIALTVEQKRKILVVTPNVDHIVKLEKNRKFLDAYTRAELVLVDGTPLMWISKWYNVPLKEKITGPRLTEKVMELSAKRKFKVFILGAAKGVAEVAAEKMMLKYNGLEIVGCYSPKKGFENDMNEITHILSIINDAEPDILIAGMGSPKTEIFLNENLENIKIHVALSIGAAIDFMAGNVKRCPLWINKIGMEWLYRFLKEPRRMFKRYFVDDIAIIRLAFRYKPKKEK